MRSLLGRKLEPVGSVYALTISACLHPGQSERECWWALAGVDALGLMPIVLGGWMARAIFYMDDYRTQRCDSSLRVLISTGTINTSTENDKYPS